MSTDSQPTFSSLIAELFGLFFYTFSVSMLLVLAVLGVYHLFRKDVKQLMHPMLLRKHVVLPHATLTRYSRFYYLQSFWRSSFMNSVRRLLRVDPYIVGTHDVEVYPPTQTFLHYFTPPIAFPAQQSIAVFNWWYPHVFLLRSVLFVFPIFICFCSMLDHRFYSYSHHVGYLIAAVHAWAFDLVETNPVNGYMSYEYDNGGTHVSMYPFSLLGLLDFVAFRTILPLFAHSCFIYLMLSLAPCYGVKDVRFVIDDFSAIRTRIRSLVLPHLNDVADLHSHPQAARSRNQADSAINQYISINGYVPYCIQMSSRDVLNGLNGSLLHKWDVDMHSPERADTILPTHFFKMINVDYYVDWTDYLWMAKPFMLFTFTPQDPCGSFQESNWTVDEDNFITMTIAGGATYKHQLWDYNVDSFRAVYPGVEIVYSVESVPVNPHWSIVLITPKAILVPSATDFVDSMRRKLHPKGFHSLKRCTFVHKVETMAGPSVSAMIRHDGDNPLLSLSIPGLYSSIHVTPVSESIITTRARIGQMKIHDLVVLLAGDFGDDVRLAQALIFNALPVKPVEVSRHTPFSTTWSQRDIDASYRKVALPSLIPQEKLMGRVLCPPVLDDAWMPMRSLANEQHTLDKRIKAVRNPQLEFLPRYQGFSAEFIEQLLPTPHVLTPYDVSHVIESQKRATQIANNAQASPRLADYLAAPDATVKSFTKGEVYADPTKDPRNISTQPTEQCLLYSQYTQALSARLKQHHCYAFSRTPDEVAARVHYVACTSRTLTETDFSRFDGTHSHALYNMELAIFLRAFPPSEHAVLRRVHQAMTTASGRTTLGLRYEPDGGRLSGAADTSIMNTVDNMFVAFCVYRRQGCTPAVAFARLGVYGGDDGISGDTDPIIYEQVTSDLGLKLKAVSRPSHARTTFLGRVYPTPTANATHMADLPRQLGKLHAHPSREEVHPYITLFNKATGHLAVDPQTPILSHWARMILRTCPVELRILKPQFQSYMFKTFGSLTSTPTLEVMEAVACDVLKISSLQLKTYCDHLDSLVHVDELQPLFMDAKRVRPPPGTIIGSDVGLVAPVATTHCVTGCHPRCPHRNGVRDRRETVINPALEAVTIPLSPTTPPLARPVTANDSKRAPVDDALSPAPIACKTCKAPIIDTLAHTRPPTRCIPCRVANRVAQNNLRAGIGVKPPPAIAPAKRSAAFNGAVRTHDSPF